MSFNHRYIWSTAFVKNLLRTECLSEAASFRYFLAIIVFDWLQFTLVNTQPRKNISEWYAAGSWATFAVIVFGLLYLYRKNGGASGKQFLSRYFSLAVTVGWKFLVAMVVGLLLFNIIFADQSAEALGWSSNVLATLINIVMYWRIGLHLKSLCDEAVQTTVN